MKVNNLQKGLRHILTIMITIAVLLGQTGGGTITAFADCPVDPTPGGGGGGTAGGGGSFEFFSDYNILLGNSEGISQTSYRYENFDNEEVEFQLNVTSVVIGDPDIAILDKWEEWWDIEPVKDGETTLTICYNYEATISEQPISGSNSETVNLTVSKYKALLNLDSYYSRILPGESVQFSAKLQEAVKNEYGQYDFRDVENATFELIEEDSYEKVMNEPEPTGNSKWTVSSKVDSSKPGGIEHTGGTDYTVKAKIGENVVAQSDEITVYVSSKFYEVHNKGDLENNIPYSTRSLLQGEEINAICSGDAAEYEVWKKYYNNGINVENVSSSDSIKQFVFYEGQEPFNPIYEKEFECRQMVADDNNGFYKLPWAGCIDAHVEILEEGESETELYTNPVPVKVMGYDMKFDGLNHGEYDEFYGNRVGVFLSSDAVNPVDPEVKVKAEVDYVDMSSSWYQMQYTIGYVSEDTDWEFEGIECDEIPTETTGNADEYFYLSSDALNTLYEKYKDESGDYCEIIVKVKAFKKNDDGSLGPAYYSSDKFRIVINKTTETNFYFDDTVMPGEYIEIEKYVKDRRFVNEFVPDGGYVDYIVSGEPIVIAENSDWYSVRESDDEKSWLIEISSNAQSAFGKSATVSLNYVLSSDGKKDVERNYKFKFNVVKESLHVNYVGSWDSLELLFSESTVIEPEVIYDYYDETKGEVLSKRLSDGTLKDVEVSIERIGTFCSVSDESRPEEYGNGFTKFEKVQGDNKWKITAISPDECNYPAIGSGYDEYRITAKKGSGQDVITGNEDIHIWVYNNKYAVEYKGGDPIKININGNEEDRKIKLSDFAFYKYYVKGISDDGSWVGKTPVGAQLKFDTRYMNTYYFNRTADDFIIVNNNINKLDLPAHSKIYIMVNSNEIREIDVEINNGSSKPEDKPDNPSGPSGGNSAQEDKKPEEEKNTEKSVNVDVPKSSMTELNGEVSVTIDSKSVIDSIGQDTKEVTINAKSSAQDVVASHVNVPYEIIKSVANAEASLEIKTSLGNIKLDKESIDIINKKVNVESITFNTEKVKAGSTYANYDVTLLVNGKKKISKFGNGKLNITFDIPQKVNLNKGAKALYKDGQYFYDMFGQIDVANKTISFETNHLSTYIVASINTANKKLISSAKKTKTKALKLSPKKGKIQISWKRGEGNQPASYIVYRSLKKNSGYKKVAHVKNGNMKFVDNKHLKKGKKYFYKVQGKLKVDGEKVYTKFTPVKSIKAK